MESTFGERGKLASEAKVFAYVMTVIVDLACAQKEERTKYVRL